MILFKALSQFTTNDILFLVFMCGLLFLLLCAIVFIVYKFFKKIKSNKNTTKNKDMQNTMPISADIESQILLSKEREIIEKTMLGRLAEKISECDTASLLLEKKIIEENLKLEKLANLSQEQAKKILLENTEKQLANYINKKIIEANDIIKNKTQTYAQQILIDSMESIAESFVSQKTTSTIPLGDDSLKGRIIGKEGRNKREFEMLTGVDLIIEKTPELTISSTNPLRRQLAKLLMEKLIKIKNIEPTRIEKAFFEEQRIFNDNLYQYAEKVIEDDLKIFDINHDLYQIIGRLYFRTSYGQNVLNHMKESALIAQNIAIKLKLNPEKAKKAAFLHDLGKAIDYEVNNDHVASGVKLAKQYNFEPYIINAIESHHNGCEIDNPYSAIVKIADTISAARPGARIDSYEEFIERVETMEALCTKFDGVKNAYVVRSGRVIRVIVEPSIINDNNFEKLAYDIKEEIESNTITNRFQVEVILYRTNTIDIKTIPKIAQDLKKEKINNN